MRHAARTSATLAAIVLLTACSREPTAQERERPTPADFTPGVSVFGVDEYIEYIPGNLPVIFSAPHGGGLQPAGIPVRVAGACGGEATTVRDANTQELARAIRDAFHAATGGYPHIVINRLHRDRLDANRPVLEAACGNAKAEIAWRDYHDFLQLARATVVKQHGRGWYTDLHGHGHPVPRLELGYTLGAATLRLGDAELDASVHYEASSSFRTFSEASPASFSALLRGPTALGTLFASAGYPAVPSAQDPAPDEGEAYFSGGYNTDRHACAAGGTVCGVQIEAPRAGVRATAEERAAFAEALVRVYRQFLRPFGIDIPG